MSISTFYLRLTGDSGSLRARSIRASALNLLAIFFQRGLSLVSNLIMTRMLVPESFGLMAMVVTVHVMLQMMSDIGINQSVIRARNGEDPDFLRAAWSVQIVRSSAIAILVAVAALLMGILGPRLAPPDSVYADPQLPWLIAVSSLAVVFSGLESTGMALARRRLELGRVTQIDVGCQIVVLILMVLLVQWKATVWVLLSGLIAGNFIRMVWSHLAFREVPMRWNWNQSIATDMWEYGRWLILSSMAGFVVNQGDRFILGAFLDKTTFGIYVIATLWMDVGEQFISRIAGEVTVAGLAETLRNRRDRFPQVFRKVLTAYGIIVVLAFLGAFFLGPMLIELLYAADYQAAGWMLPLLAFRYFARRTSPYGAFLLAEGHSRTMAFSNMLTGAFVVVALPLSYWYLGFPATLMVVALSPMVAVPIVILASRRIFPELPGRSEAVLYVAVLAAAVMVILSGSHGA